MKSLAAIGTSGALIGVAALVAVAVLIWPPGWLVGGLLAAAGVLLLGIAGLVIALNASPAIPLLSKEELAGLGERERLQHQLRALADHERRIEIRELRLARQLRIHQLAGDETVDVLDTEVTDEELSRFTEKDLQLMALIEQESQRAFDRILNNRYAAGNGVDTALILTDLRDFIETVARLYRPESKDPLLETEIERIAKSLSSTSLHLLMIVDSLPIDLKSYNTAKMYRLLRRSASYYGTYKAVRPYLEQGMNAVQLARLALGFNPIAVGAAWIAGKITAHGARALGERMLQRKALELLTDFIRVVGFEAAMIYGGDFRHRDANWVLGAVLVNLEIARGNDLQGRDAALATICRLALRHEFDRIHLLSHLARHRTVDAQRAQPQVTTTVGEREKIAARLADHIRETRADPGDPAITNWREQLESQLGIVLELDGAEPLQRAPRQRRLIDRLRRRRPSSRQ